MAVVHYVDAETLLPGGDKLLRGKLTIGSTGAGQTLLNLANYLKDDQTPCVFVSPIENATNKAFSLGVNTCNAEVIGIKAYVTGLSAEDTLQTANAGLELTAHNVDFLAIGRSY